MSKPQVMNDEDYLQTLDLVDRLWSSDDPKDLELLDSLAEQIESYEASELNRILSTPNNEREQ